MEKFIRIFVSLIVTFSFSHMYGMQEIWKDPRTPVLVSVKGFILEREEVELLQKYRPVGVILFKNNCDSETQVMKLTGHLKSLGFLVAIDIEGKCVNRFRDFHPLEKDAVDFLTAPLTEIYDYYFGIAQYSRNLGVDIIFGPVTDVCDIPTSFIIRRCFSGDAKKVSECAFTVVKAYQDAGIFPVMKHLPGHGKAADSHLELPTVHASMEELFACDIAAPRLVIKSVMAEGRPLPGGMLSHVIYDKIDQVFPGTLSEVIIQEFVKKHIGINDSIIFSDAMCMNALVDFLVQKNLATAETYRPVALTGFLEAGGDIAIMDLITNFELTPDSFSKKDPHIMLKMLKCMRIIK